MFSPKGSDFHFWEGRRYIRIGDEKTGDYYRIAPGSVGKDIVQVVHPVSGNVRVTLVKTENGWERAALMGGGPKKIAALRQQNSELRKNYKAHSVRQAEVEKNLQFSMNQYRKDPLKCHELYEKTLNNNIDYYKEGINIVSELGSIADAVKFVDVKSKMIAKIIDVIRRLNALYAADLKTFRESFLIHMHDINENVKYAGELESYQKCLEKGIVVSGKYTSLLEAEETYMHQLKLINGTEGNLFKELPQSHKSSISSFLLKAEEVPFLARFSLHPQPPGSNDVIYQDLLKSFDDNAKCLENACRIHRQAVDDTSFSSPDRLDLLRSVVDQYQKASMHYETLEHVYSPSINRMVVSTVMARIKDLQQTAQSDLNLLEAEVELITVKIPAGSVPRTSARIFNTKKYGLVIGKIRVGKAADGTEVMDMTDFTSGKVIASYKETKPGNWQEISAPDLPMPTSRPATGFADLLKLAKQGIDNSARYIANANNQAWKGYLPVEIEEILVQQADRMKKYAAQLRAGTDAASQSEAIALAQKLEEKADNLVARGHALRVEMTLKASPTPSSVEYLDSLGMLKISKTLSRKPMAAHITMDPITKEIIKEGNFLDEYEIVVNGKIWAYAHLHYTAKNTPDTFFAKAHLKLPQQRYETGKDIHYGNFHASFFKKLFLKAPADLQ